MKKILYLLLAGGMFLTACDLTGAKDDKDNNGGKGSGGNGGGGNTVESDEASQFSVDLSYTSTSPSTDKASLDIGTLSAVSASEGDVTLCWQKQFGYIMTSPDGSIIKQLYQANTVAYNNTKNTTICKLSGAQLSDYDQISELNSLTVTSGSITDIAGKNQVLVQSGDIIAFQKGSVKGVGQVTGLSKVTKKITFRGYVNTAANSSTSK